MKRGKSCGIFRRKIEAPTASPVNSLKPFKNTLTVLGNTPMVFYFSSPQNLAFQDLTKVKIATQAAKSVLGLWHKFITVPNFTPQHDILGLL